MGAAYGITLKQKEVLDFIEDFINENGHSPSYREISSSVGISLSGVSKALNHLMERSLIHRLPNKSRSIAVASDFGFNLAQLFTKKEWALVCASAEADGKTVGVFVRESAVTIAELIQDQGL